MLYSAFVSSTDSNSEDSIDAVPISTGCPFASLDLTSSTIAWYLSEDSYKPSRSDLVLSLGGGRNYNDIKAIYLLEFISFSVCRSCHARYFLVEAKVVLECSGC